MNVCVWSEFWEIFGKNLGEMKIVGLIANFLLLGIVNSLESRRAEIVCGNKDIEFAYLT